MHIYFCPIAVMYTSLMSIISCLAASPNKIVSLESE